ncbi:bifunctional phosphoribosyl-AMP cyclohydrolase/phosphoribosyl-ATP diphosphatase HisIE [Macrococcus sp. EM39E]|uniref:bifunctional phosphoribosyl-AMP cyclohydrolase/phosphoribosyl-ATP diphosphatase HisIE n=1 Tax=Macrococcus animalis TaxID=3395467 RepID=UPI0039BF9C92
MHMKPNFDKGLLTVVLQHAINKNVLMVGYMNEEAYNKTVQENIVTFYSRSKERLWTKGESSGHFQHVVSMALDCDSDALLIQVNPIGPTCHNGTESCFNLKPSVTLESLINTVVTSATLKNDKSYTQYLLNSGIDKIAKKFGEESFEVVIAALKNDKEELKNEVSDLLYHLAVLMYQQNLKYEDVEKELALRHNKQNNFKGERKDIQSW